MKNIKKIAAYGLFVVICIGFIAFLVSRTKIDTMKSNQAESSVHVQNQGGDSEEDGMDDTDTAGSIDEGIDDEMNMEEPTFTWSAPDAYTYELNDAFRFEADVIVSGSFTNGIFHKTKGIYQEWDADAFYDIFFRDEDIAEEYTYGMLDRTGKKAEGRAFFTADRDTVCMYPDTLIYHIGDWDDYFTIFTYLRANYDGYNIYKYSLTDQLSFAAREEVVQTVLDTVNEIGCEADDIIYKAYALDTDTMNQETERIIAEGMLGDTLKKGWKSEEEAYGIFIWQEVQGLPVWTTEINGYTIADESSAPASAIYGKDGYIHFQIYGFMDFEMSDEYDVLLSFEEITDKICEKYKDVISSDTIVVQEMMLCLLTSADGDGGYNLYPAWLCTYENEGGNSMGQMIFDAVTGNELYEN